MSYFRELKHNKTHHLLNYYLVAVDWMGEAMLMLCTLNEKHSTMQKLKELSQNKDEKTSDLSR